MKIELEIHGNPVAQGRPKFYRRGNFVGAYDPGKSKSWKEDIKIQVLNQLNGPQILEGALEMNLLFRMPRPKTLPKKTLYHIKRPDIDNLAKSCKDALSGICYKDDSQIVKATLEKRYSHIPGVRIIISQIEQEAS